MSCIVLNIELADIFLIGSWGFFDEKVRGCSYRPSKSYEPTKQTFWCTRNLRETVWVSGCLDYSRLPKNLPRDVKGGYFAKRKKSKIVSGLLDKEVGKSNDQSHPKIRDLVEP